MGGGHTIFLERAAEARRRQEAHMRARRQPEHTDRASLHGSSTAVAPLVAVSKTLDSQGVAACFGQ
jgi:hypothetical protein